MILHGTHDTISIYMFRRFQIIVSHGIYTARTGVLPGKGHLDRAGAEFCACSHVGRMASWLKRLVSNTPTINPKPSILNPET